MFSMLFEFYLTVLKSVKMFQINSQTEIKDSKHYKERTCYTNKIKHSVINSNMNDKTLRLIDLHNITIDKRNS